MQSPEVLSGARAPRTVRMEDARRREAASEPAPTVAPVGAPAGVNVYISKYSGYRVQITAPQSFSTTDGRKQSGGRMIVALFDNGRYVNNERDPKVRALIDEELQRNPYFGKFGDSIAHYWLLSEQQTALESARIKSAMATLKSLPPEVVEQFVGELKQGDAEDHKVTAGDSAHK